MSLALIRTTPAVELNPEQQLAVEHGIGEPAAPGRCSSSRARARARRRCWRIGWRRSSSPAPIRSGSCSPPSRAARRRSLAGGSSGCSRGVSRPRPPAAATPAYAGTFHAIGARLLREYAPRIGLDPQFTIHDREDSADLMNWARHEAGLTETPRALSDQGDLPRHLFARRQRPRRTQGRFSANGFPGSRRTRRRLRALFALLCRDEAAPERARLRRPAALFRPDAGRAGDRGARSPARFDHLLVDEYQDTNALQGEIVLALRPQGRGLTVVGDDAQAIYSFRAATVRNILDFPRAFDPPARVVTLERNYRSTRRRSLPPPTRRSRSRPSASPRTSGPTGAAGAARCSSPSPTRPIRRASSPTASSPIARRARRSKSQAVLFRASHHSAALELELTRRNMPFVKFGGLKFLDAAHVKDALALMRFAENPRDRVAGFRVAQLLPGVGPKIAEAIVAAAAADDGFAAMAALSLPAQGAGRLSRLRRSHAPARRARRAVAGARSPTPSPGSRRCIENALRRRAGPDGRSRSARAHRRLLSSRERFLSELALDPPDATSDEAGPPLTRRGLSHPLDHPLGQGAGMALGVRPELRRRLHSLRSRDRLVGGDRGGAAPALCRDDAGQGRARAHRAAALLCPRPAEDTATATSSRAAPGLFPRRC